MVLRYLSLVLFLLIVPFNASADDSIRKYVPEIKKWLDNDLVYEALREQNKENANLTLIEIDRIDQRWRRETLAANQPMLEEMLDRELSKYLYSVRQSHDDYTEVFIMDNRGINVGQSDPSADIWQGGKPNWIGTFHAGPGAVHVGLTGMNEVTQMKQTYLSLAIEDPDSGEVIGVVSVGIKAE